VAIESVNRCALVAKRREDSIFGCRVIVDFPANQMAQQEVSPRLICDSTVAVNREKLA
jgi:hypothetical protein